MTPSTQSNDKSVAVPGSPRASVYGIVRVLLGLVLILAAVLKTEQYLEAPPYARLWIILQIEGEWLLGLWLLSGVYRRLAWTLALASFAALATVAGWKGFAGEKSCGCFGTWEINPWITLGVDIAAVLGLFLARRGAWVLRPLASQRLAISSALLVGLLIGLPAAIWMATRPAVGLSPAGQQAVAAAAGHSPESPMTSAPTRSPTLPPPQLAKEHLVESLGYVAPKGRKPLDFVIVNPTDRPMKILKIEIECKCEEFPTKLSDLAPYGSLPIHAVFVAPDIHDRYSKHIVLFTDQPKTKPIVLQIVARVGLPLETQPETLEPQAGKPDEPFALVNEGQQPIRILYAIASVRGITVPAPRDAVLPSDKKMLTAHIDWASVPKGTRLFVLELHTDLASQPVLEIHGELPSQAR